MLQATVNLNPTVRRPDDERDTERVPLTDSRAGAVSIDPQRRSGVPCFAGTRVPIHDLFDYLAGGEPLGSFLESFPSVSREQAERVLVLAEDRLFDGLSSMSREVDITYADEIAHLAKKREAA